MKLTLSVALDACVACALRWKTSARRWYQNPAHPITLGRLSFTSRLLPTQEDEAEPLLVYNHPVARIPDLQWQPSRWRLHDEAFANPLRPTSHSNLFLVTGSDCHCEPRSCHNSGEPTGALWRRLTLGNRLAPDSVLTLIGRIPYT